MSLNAAESRFYARQLRLPEVGPEGQARLRASSALVVGLGGLGSPVSLYLAAAGVGRLGLVEFDRVEESNLHRQVLFGHGSLGRPKLEAAIARLRDLNPHIELDPVPGRLDAGNARALVRRHDVVVDGTDNFETRFLANDAAVLEGKPLVSASILAFEGQLSVYHHRGGPCWRCLYPEPPPPGAVPACGDAGVLGVLPGVMGTLQALETIKVLLGWEGTLTGRLLAFDALELTFRELRIARSPGCAACGDAPRLRQLGDLPTSAPGACAAPAREVSPLELKAWLERADAPTLLDVREPAERAAGAILPSIHVPLAEVAARARELPRDRALVVYCRSGRRSAAAIAALAPLGFAELVNLAGGALAWRDEVDAALVVGNPPV